MFDFGFLLKQLRKEKGYSQARVAGIIHKSKNVISDYENNIAMPSLDTLISLAQLYNVPLDYLAGIDKREAIVIENLSESQKELLKLITEDFLDNKNYRDVDGLTKRQHDIVGDLVGEFVKKKSRN